MKFFVPGAKDDQHAEKMYAGITKFNSGIAEITGRRIFAIDYLHNGKLFHNEVGKPDPIIDDMVLAILEAESRYYVCTINRGVMRGEPILVGFEEVSGIIDFDPRLPDTVHPQQAGK